MIFIPGGAPEKGWGDDGRGATPRRLPARLATRTKASLSAAAADFKSMGCASTRRIFRGVRYPVVRGQVRRLQLTVNLIPLEFVGASYRPLRSLTFLGNALLQPRKQSSSCVSDTLHPEYSFSDAVELHLQSTTGVFGNVRKAFGEIRNA